MKLSNMSELDDLMDEAAYSNFVKESEEEWCVCQLADKEIQFSAMSLNLVWILQNLEHNYVIV